MPNQYTNKDPEPTPRAKLFLDKIIADPTTNHSKAYREVYQDSSGKSSNAAAAKLLHSKTAQLYKKKHIKLAKDTILDVLTTARENRDKPAFSRLALDSANSLLDRQLGKAVQKTEVNSTNLNLNVEANQQMADDFTNFLKAKTQQE